MTIYTSSLHDSACMRMRTKDASPDAAATAVGPLLQDYPHMLLLAAALLAAARRRGSGRLRRRLLAALQLRQRLRAARVRWQHGMAQGPVRHEQGQRQRLH